MDTSKPLPVRKIKTESLIVSSVCLAVSVSIAGNIGFVGLAAPHIVRRIFREALNSEMLFCVGGSLIMTAALMLRALPAGVFVPAGTAVSLLGAPIFVYILLKSNR